MKKFFWVKVLVLTIFSISFAEKYGLIIGTYPKKEENEKFARAVQNDLYKIQSLLIDFGFKVDYLYGENATSENVKKYLKKFSKLSKNDVFVFYFSGEGGTIKDTSGDEKDNLDEVYILYDYDLDKKTGFLVDDEFGKYSNKIKAKKLFIIDACFSQSLYRNVQNKDFFIKSKGFIPEITDEELISKDIIILPKYDKKLPKSDKSKYVILSAAKENERAYLGKNGSIFTESLVKVIKNWQNYDKNKNHKFELIELKEAVQNEVLKSIEELNKNQSRNIPFFHPQLKCENVDEEHTDFFEYIGYAFKKPAINLEKYLDELINSGRYGRIDVETSKKNYSYREFVNITINPNGSSGYLYIFYVDKNNYTVLFPNKFNPKHIYLKGNEKYIKVPGKFSNRFKLIADKPFGKTSVYAVILPEKLDITLSKKEFFKVFKKGSEEEREVVKGISVIGVNNNISIGKATFYVKEK